jgi:hypothetical protein
MAIRCLSLRGSNLSVLREMESQPLNREGLRNRRSQKRSLRSSKRRKNRKKRRRKRIQR